MADIYVIRVKRSDTGDVAMTYAPSIGKAEAHVQRIEVYAASVGVPVDVYVDEVGPMTASELVNVLGA